MVCRNDKVQPPLPANIFSFALVNIMSQLLVLTPRANVDFTFRSRVVCINTFSLSVQKNFRMEQHFIVTAR